MSKTTVIIQFTECSFLARKSKVAPVQSSLNTREHNFMASASKRVEHYNLRAKYIIRDEAIAKRSYERTKHSPSSTFEAKETWSDMQVSNSKDKA